MLPDPNYCFSKRALFGVAFQWVVLPAVSQRILLSLLESFRTLPMYKHVLCRSLQAEITYIRVAFLRRVPTRLLDPDAKPFAGSRKNALYKMQTVSGNENYMIATSRY